MNEVFNFKRFGTYFKYDLVQMWRNHTRAAVLIGCSGLILYLVWVSFSLVFGKGWNTPGIEARAMVLMFAFMVLQFYQTRTYGYLTEKKAGSAWLMIPASRTEKFVSMLLITLVVLPILFFAVYFLIDGFLALVDPTVEGAVIAGTSSALSSFVDTFNAFKSESPVEFSIGGLVGITILSFFADFMYFLLCGICFKKNKIGKAIAILIGFSFLVSIIAGLLAPQLINLPGITPETGVRATVGFLNASVVLEILMALGLGWGIWYRIKTIQQ